MLASTFLRHTWLRGAMVSLLLLGVALLGLALGHATAAAACGGGTPTVATDKPDYAPNETAHISGSGYGCAQTLTIKVTRPDGSVVKGDGSFAPGSDTVVTDSAGNFTYDYILDGISGVYTVEVVDANGVVLASTTFLDSHFRFGHITWVKTGPRTANFTFTLGMRNYGSFNVGQNIGAAAGGVTFGDGTSTSPSFTVTYRSGPDVNRDWFLATATFNHTYPGTGPYTVSNSSCCRQITLQHVNNPDGNWRVTALVNFNYPGNPVSALPAIVDCVQNSANGCNFFVAAADPTPETPMRWRLSTPSEWAVSYQPGPCPGCGSPAPAAVNPNTGQYTWNTIGATVRIPGNFYGGLRSDGTTLYSTQVTIEDLTPAGAVATKSVIDFMLQLKVATANQPPRFDVPPTPASGTTLGAGVGQTLTFPVRASDADGSDMVTLGIIGLPAGATFPIPAAANPASSTFTWTPTAAQVGGYVVVFTATDNRGGSAPVHSIAINVSAMSLTKSAAHVSGPNPPQVGATSFFDVFMDLSLPANAPSPVNGIVVTDQPGAQATFQGNLAASQGTITYAPNTVTWNVGSLAPGGRSQGQFRVSVTPTAANLGSPMVLNQSAVATGTDAGSGLRVSAVSNTVSTQPVVQIVNRPPTANAGGPYTVPEGSATTLSGSGTDPDGDPLTFAWDLDNNGTFETPGQTATYSAAGKDGPSANTVGLRVCDDKGACTNATAQVNVTNVAPTPSIGGAPATSPEGTAITLSGSATDPSPADTAAGLALAWSVTKNGAPYASGSGASLSFTPDDNGAYVATLTATDKDGGTGTTSASITVTNVAPTVNAGADATIFSGQSHTVAATFTDPSTVDTHTANINWGDSSPTQVVTVVQSAGSGSLSASHQYFVPGIYTVTVSVTDDDGGTGQDTLQVEVRRLVVPIDIKPGSDPNSINLGNNGNVPVGVFTGTYSGISFDATTIVRSSLLFAGAPALSIGQSPQDLDGDGDLDMVFHFATQSLNLTSTSTQATLTGQTSGNIYFKGTDSVRVVPPKK